MSICPAILNSRLRVRPGPVLLNQLKFRTRTKDLSGSLPLAAGAVIPVRNFDAISKHYSSSSSSPPEFKSSISLDKLYPKSSVNLAKQPNEPKIPEQKDPNKFTGYIPIGIIDRLDMSHRTYTHELTVYDRQKPAYTQVTAVTIRFHVESADWLPQSIRENFLKKYRNLISKDGYFTINSDRTWTKLMNTADAMEKLREMIRSCEPQLTPAEPAPETLETSRRKREKFTREVLHRRGRAQPRESDSNSSAKA